ncbi:MAG: tRNA (adenosine(37)-N6)-threonylcarbamoyltransferase complex ATPase subunit type 1 TsaE [Flavobacteriales bacterium]|jgi:tRNA threonylcarbamoyladenosine biosynthesis protein TsaE
MVRQASTVEAIPAIAAEFLAAHPHGGHFAIMGEMGVGKTTFMSAVCQSLGLDFEGSPTFSLVNEYHLPDGKRLFHFDLYRLNSPQELSAIGFEEYLDSGHYIFIEWPEQAGSLTESMPRILITESEGIRTFVFPD